MNKQTRIKIIGGTLLGLLLILAIASMPIWGDDQEEDNFNDVVPKISQDESFSIEDMTSFNNDDNYTIEAPPTTDLVQSKADSLLDRIHNESNDSVITEDDIYKNEESEENLLVQQKIQELEAERLRLASQQNVAISSIPKVVPPELSAAEKRLEYLKRLRKEREAYDKRTLSNNNNPTKELLQVKAIIYGDQYVMPNDRLELMLSEKITYNGKTFKKGTPVFAYISINESRVMLDIRNIVGEPMEIRSYDSYDYREGIYSTRAGELWRAYKDQQTDNANNETSDRIGNSTKSKLVSGAIKDLGDFFRGMKLKKNRKILLLNDHKVTLKIR